MTYKKGKIILFVLLQEIIGLATPFLAGLLVQQLVYQNWNSFMYGVMILLVLPILEGIVFWLREHHLSLTIENAGLSLRRAMLKHMFNVPFSFFLSSKTGEQLTRYTEDIRVIVQSERFALESLRHIVAIIVITSVLTYQNWWLLSILVINIIIYLVQSKVINPYIRRLFASHMAYQDQANEYLRERMDILPLTRFSGSTEWEVKQFQEVVEKRGLPILQKTAMFRLLVSFISGMTQTGSILFIYGLGGYLLIQGNITLGGLVMATGYATRISGITDSITECYQKYKAALISRGRIQEVLTIPTEEQLTTGEVIKHVNKICLNHICFQYPDRKQVFGDLSLELRANEIVALVGASGAGKTTLTQILLGLLKIQKGSIMINDTIPFDQINMEHWRQHIAYAPQFPYFFTDTIQNNLMYSARMNEALLKRRLQQFDMDRMIANRVDGLHTMMSEKSGFSGGQKQRLGLARILSHEKPLLYILDEPTSFLDSFTEKKIMDVVVELKREAPVLLIAHRLSTVVHADRVILIEHGTIMEEGTYEELLGNNGRFSQLYEKELEQFHNAAG